MRYYFVIAVIVLVLTDGMHDWRMRSLSKRITYLEQRVLMLESKTFSKSTPPVPPVPPIVDPDIPPCPNPDGPPDDRRSYGYAAAR